MNIFLIVGFILVVTAVVLVNNNGKGSAWFIFVLTYFGSGLFLYGTHADEPKAIDVYKGKTTLVITYKDNIPVDTVVVFKDK